MSPNEYVSKAMTFNDGRSTDRILKMIRMLEGVKGQGIDAGGVLNASLGMAGETGEVLDMIKKWYFHEKQLDAEHLKKEIGDVMWYIALMCYSFGFDLEDILEQNYSKLSERYPEGYFSTFRANNRKSGDV